LLSSVATQGVLMVLTMLLFGASFHFTSLGSQNNPYPPRTTILLDIRYAKPRRGLNIFLLMSVGFRLFRSSEFTSPSLPLSGRPVGPASGFSAPGRRI